MQRKKISAEKAKEGDKVSIEMKQGSDRDGVVASNDARARTLQITGDNFVSISLHYDKIEKIEKLVD
ncbi:MAG: hypothetical protein U9Q85_00440 [Patescibacteria group bacterium]|nr:hypothetical protein [Patescibacteria group bacterium]